MEFYRRQLPKTCIAFDSSEGKRIFQEALLTGHMECYFKLAAQLRTQDEPAFCGLATLVMTLNALQVDPGRLWKGPWRWYHEEMLDCCVPLDVVKKKGIVLSQFGCLANCNGLTTTITRVDESASFEKFKKLVEETSCHTDQVLVVNISRATLGQTGDGHFAPIGGYHPEKCLVLLFDTARFKYPPHWISLDLLWNAMARLDKETNKPRGYVLLKTTSSASSLILFKTSDSANRLFMAPGSVTEDSSSQLLHNFLVSFCSWLDTASPADPVSDENVIATVVSKAIELMITYNSDDFVLTWQTLFNSKEPTLYKVLHEIVNDIAGCSLAGIVTEKLNSVPGNVCLKSLNMTNVYDLNVAAGNIRMIFMCGFILSFPYNVCDNTASWGSKMGVIINKELLDFEEESRKEICHLNYQMHSLKCLHKTLCCTKIEQPILLKD